MSDSKPVHIIGLRAENVQRLELVELDLKPRGGVVEIRGRNGAGKSTILNCLQMALGGARAVSEQPVRSGAETAEITVTTSNGLTITRRFNAEGKTYLEVRDADGWQAAKPQTMLDRLIGGRTLDPHAFMLSSDKDRAERLRAIAGVDTRAIDAEIQNRFEERAAANRDVAREEQRSRDLPDVPPETGGDVVDLADLCRRRDEAAEHNAQGHILKANAHGADVELKRRDEALRSASEAIELMRDRQRQELDEIQARHEREQGDAEQSKAMAEEAHKLAVAAAQSTARSAEEWDPVDLTALDALIAKAREHDKRLGLIERHEEQAAAIKKAKRAAKELTSLLEQARKSRQDMIESASMPVDGLGFSESGGVTFNDLPFEQAAHSEQLRVSLAIAMAAAPDLRVINFTDASLLDAESMQIVRELAEGDDYQILAEFVDSQPGESGIFIEAGRVTHVDGEAIS